MAIDNMQGKVSTTGIMNNMPIMPKGKVNPQLQTGGSQPLPEDPTKPVNPFGPKPTGPVLPNKKIAQNHLKSFEPPKSLLESRTSDSF